MGTIRMNTAVEMISRRLALHVLLVWFSLSAGCTLVTGMDVSGQRALEGAPVHIGGFDVIKLTADRVAQINTTDSLSRQAHIEFVHSKLDHRTEDGYVIGPGDVLTIIVWEHPELTSPTGEFRDPESAGRLVGADGSIYYPYIGELNVEGLPVRTIRRLIAARLARVVKNPQVDVRVAAFRSQTVKVLGDVRNPAPVPVTDRGITIAEAIAAVGGVTENASKRYVILRRDGESIEVDLHGVSKRGISALDLILKQDDILEVPSSIEYPVYMFGAFGRQSVLPLPEGRMSLAQAIASVEGLNSETADRKKVYVIRSRADGDKLERVTAYLLRFDGFTSLALSQSFNVKPGDVVYVDRTGLSSYNTIVAKILPTVSTLFQLDRLLIDQ
ncbi:polysaccharide biosynthesis/export family protein [Abyssibacter profundi]|nr:polysaccharide biosynthesis/export family protein [Abyssibacter profundi]